MIELTDEMRHILDESHRHGVRVWMVDPKTRQEYVILRRDEYDLVKGHLGEEDEWDGVDVARLWADAMREDDENDPTLESYQEYDKPHDPSR